MPGPEDRLSEKLPVVAQWPQQRWTTTVSFHQAKRLSRSLCELLGYKLEAESEPGRGSTFRIVLKA